jgi:hypothetical protein
VAGLDAEQGRKIGGAVGRRVENLGDADEVVLLEETWGGDHQHPGVFVGEVVELVSLASPDTQGLTFGDLLLDPIDGVGDHALGAVNGFVPGLMEVGWRGLGPSASMRNCTSIPGVRISVVEAAATGVSSQMVSKAFLSFYIVPTPM